MCLYVCMCMFLRVDSAGRHVTVHVWRSATVGIGPHLPCLRSLLAPAHTMPTKLPGVSCLTVAAWDHKHSSGWLYRGSWALNAHPGTSVALKSATAQTLSPLTSYRLQSDAVPWRIR